VKKGAITALVVVAVAMSYAFVDDLLNGLPHTRASSSWVRWAGGLVVLGVAGLLVEGAIEWALERRDSWRPGLSRPSRVAVVMVIVATVVGACILLSGYLT